MQNSLQIIIIYVTAGFSVALIGYMIVRKYFSIVFAAQQEAGYSSATSVSLKEYLRPFGDFLASKADSSEFITAKVGEYDTLLLQAGSFMGGVNAYEVLAYKFILPVILFVFIMFGGFIVGFPSDYVLLVALFFMFAGYMYPDSTLNAQAAKRKSLFMKQLPGGLDILKVAADSGLDFYSSVNYLVDIYIPGPMKEEMRTFQRELKLGILAVTALTNIAERLKIPEATTIFISLSQSIEMGTSIVDMLETTTREMRKKRLLSAESEAQKAVVKITFPLLLLILPGTFIVLLAPIMQPMMAVFSSLTQ